MDEKDYVVRSRACDLKHVKKVADAALAKVNIERERESERRLQSYALF